ncbi:unnamed protein product [Penicillium salamii]|uniref:Uncharacterized protein n=1 Tax=Penicillium salamii TaxID=1612424 RepID=A0A9W4JEJ4_9EURO|nr:unnamed protein product [Penicillium salamii]CAG8094624.1 unnamed protein product [Penicillium salamii]CAG8127422.1 unnamed protein product [Penicillium salamii]CAG8160300.1 unnamed protein product [Penicillium salamii]CAG8326268.1 unnamed protein product [Penicillium salamii]
MAYKAGEGTPQRMPNSTNNPKNLLPLKIASMSTTLPWNPFLVCEIEVSPNGGPSFCCGMTKKGAPCKNSIKLEDTKLGHQKLNSLTREPFQLSTLQPKLCAIAKEFLCARWHRQRQAEQVGQQWYEAAVRNQARVPHDSRVATPPIVHPRQRQTSSASRRRLVESDDTDRSRSHGLTQDPPVPLSTSAGPVQSINPFVTAEMLRTNSVPWHVSPARPAIVTSVTNIWAGVQDLSLQNLRLSEDVDEIHCVFCLAEDEEQGNECVILHCDQCRAHCHLSCAEEWLEKRRTGFGTSCCVCRNEGSLDALIRPVRVPSASEPSTDRESVTVRNSAPNGPRQSQLPQRSMGSPRVSVEQSGPRRSARVAVAHLSRNPSTSAPLRRSARLNPTQRN